LIFAFENQEPVALRYLYTWQTPPTPLFAIIMVAVGAGFVIASLFVLAAYLRERKIIRQQRRTIAELEAELRTLRTLPLDVPSETGGGLHGSDKPAPATGEPPQR
jgi:Lipopolysaccharide assembly protein A domain